MKNPLAPARNRSLPFGSPWLPTPDATPRPGVAERIRRFLDHSPTSGRAFYAGLLEALTQVMGTAKGYLYDHGPRVAHTARLIAREMGLPPREVAELMFGAVLCDSGMIGLAEDAWENPVAALDRSTRKRVQLHPIRSEASLSAIPHLEGVAPLVRHHHEW